MVVSLRLTRIGSHKKPYYRIIAVDERVKRDGKYLELLGFYNPLTGEKIIKTDLAVKWLKLGAKPTKTVHNILKEKGIFESVAEQKNNLPKK